MSAKPSEQITYLFIQKTKMHKKVAVSQNMLRASKSSRLYLI